MNKFVIAFLFLAGFASAESFNFPVNQMGSTHDPRDSGCELVSIDNTIAGSTVVGHGSLYWVMASSPTDGTGGEYIVISDSVSNVTQELTKVFVAASSAANAFNIHTMQKFSPPLTFRNYLFMRTSNANLDVVGCYIVKNSTIVRVASPLDAFGRPIASRGAGCVPTRVTGSAASTTEALIPVISSFGFVAPSSEVGTLVYWMNAATAAVTGSNFIFRSTGSALTSYPLAVPPISIVDPSFGTFLRFDPPFRVPNRLSIRIDTAGPSATACTRSVREF